MNKNIKILFVGSFLSRSTGTKSVSEKLQILMQPFGVEILLFSKKKNQILRMFDIILAILFKGYDFAHIDVFSGRAFFITEVAARLLILKNKKLILNLRGGKLPEFHKDNSNRIKKVFLKADRIITPSNYLKFYFQDHGYAVEYLPNFIELEKFPYKNKREWSHTFLWIRAFAKIYNPVLAIETLHLLKNKYPDIILTMIGPDKGSLSTIKILIKKYNLEENINIVGPVQNKELINYYQSHSVYLNTTNYESFGVAVLEAAACGIPIVSTKVGELPYLWEHNQEILFIDDNDPASMADQVEKLFLDKELRDKLALRAYEKAKGYRWEKVKDKWLQLLKEVSNSKYSL